MSLTTDGILYYPFTKIAKNGQGDFQRALHSSKMKQSELFAVPMNIWAMHKGFRDSRGKFAFDRTQSTPALRSPERIAAALAANYGLVIPRYALADFKTHYSDTWTYNRPRGTSYGEPERCLDFDGYVSDCYWLTGGAGGHFLYSIFNGSIGVPGDDVSAGDPIRFDIRCCDDPDTGVPGLLYPYAFKREQEHAYDLSKYYMGIGILDSSNTLRVITGDRMDAHHTLNDVDASMLEYIPNACTDGALKIIPLLASQESPVDPNTGLHTWTSSQNGYLISLNGAHLSVAKSATSENIVSEVEATFEPGNNRMRLDFTIRNASSSVDYTVSSMWAYLLSAGAYYNEYDPGYSGPYVDPPTDQYIEQSWPNTPTLTYQHHSTYNIQLSDRDGASHNPDLISAYGLSAFGGTTYGFYHANGDSAVLRHGSTVQWTQYINQTEDGYGNYSDMAAAYLGIQVSPNITFVRGPFLWEAN